MNGTMVAKELLLPKTDGLMASPTLPAPRNGLHVVVGRNNAGKTRFLNALVNAVQVAPLAVPAGNDPPTPGNVLPWDLLAGFRLWWVRTGSHEHGPIGAGNEKVAWGSGETEGLAREWFLKKQRRPPPGDVLRHAVNSIVGKLLGARPAALVSTNRSFSPHGNLGVFDHEGNLLDPATIGALDKFPALIEQLGRSSDNPTRQRHLQILDLFRDVTEGLRFASRGAGTATHLVVDEAGSERPMSHCGDGLRDLLMVLAHVVLLPDHELFIDEPGIRLHPHAQRLLLRVLEREARERPIWIASHDGVFVGAASVQTRYSVQRKDAKTSEVSKVVGRDDLQELTSHLGWMPRDAFLADRVIYCEGPSDRVAFEALLRELEVDDPNLSGTLVQELGGCDVVWGKDRAALLRQVKLLQQVAPHAEQVALLDRDGRDEREVQALTKGLEGCGLTVQLLERPDLENYWLAPSVVLKIMVQAAAAAEARGHPVAAPSLSQVQEELGKHSTEGRKGADVLEATADALRLRFDKVPAARVAVTILKQEDPDSHGCLLAALRTASQATSESCRSSRKGNLPPGAGV